MADLPLQTIVAEYSVKDLATKSVKAIDKDIQKSIKSTKDFEKELTKANSILGQMGKAAKGTAAGAAGAAGTVVQKPIGIAESTISGGMVGAAASVPIIGGLMSAIMGATGDVKDKFIAGLSLKKELMNYSVDIQKAFGKGSKDALKTFDDNFSTLAQQQKLLSGLTRGGVSAETLSPEVKANLQNLAKAQGVELDQVLNNVDTMSGMDAVQIELINRYKSMLGNALTADQGMQGIARVLEDNKSVIKAEADKRQAVTGGLQASLVESKTRETSNKLILTEEGRYLNSMAALRIAYDTEAVAIKTKGFGARVETTVVGALTEQKDTRFSEWQAAGSSGTFEQYRKEHPKKALGGSVDRGHTYQINENEQEYFTPGQSGRITPASQMNKNNSATITMNNNFYISGASQNIQQEIEAALDNVARSFSYALGMRLPQ